MGICCILELAWNCGFRFIILETDSRIAAELIAKGLENGGIRGGGWMCW